MSETNLASNVGKGVKKQLGAFPSKRPKGKKGEEEKKKKKGRPYSNEGVGRKEDLYPQGEVVEPSGSIGRGTHGEVYEGYVVAGRLPGPKKALNAPPPKAIEGSRPQGPFMAQPVVDLKEGPNFGKVVHDITSLPRQFRK